MPIDINGYTLANASGLSFDTSATQVVAANYGIRDPALPCMTGAATLNGAYKVYPFPVNNVNLNIGSCWSTSTYRFTAPVSGIYYMSYGGIVGDGSAIQTAGYYALIVNGVNYYWSYKDSISVWELHHNELLFKLAAGDWFSWAMNAAPGPVSAYTGGAYQANHNVCTIWLVG